MNLSSITNVVGKLLLVAGASMALPVICSLFYPGEGDLLPLVVSALVVVAVGLALWLRFRRHYELTIRDGFIIAVLGWVLISAASALPFLIHGSIPSLTDGFFEMMSGYTTTGATVLTDIESLPHGLLLWRSETHLLGGMGILTLTALFLPHGLGGLRIFRAESSPGLAITRERFLPRNRDAMVWLWGIYVGLNLLQTLLFCLGGMSLFDALCHSFGTISTGGYSPYDSSLGQYGSAYFDWVTIVFMILGGTAFILFYHLIRGDWPVLAANTELRWYLTILVFFCAVVSWILLRDGTYESAADSIRYGTFQVVSILTTTGFTTDNYELWPYSAQMFLFAVCFVGACSASTTSGIKIVHFVLIWKYVAASIKKIFFQRLLVTSIRLNRRPVEADVVSLALCFFIVTIFLVLGGGCVMVLVDDIGYLDGMSSCISTLMNIGPGFGKVGPAENYATISAAGKWFLSFLMLVGRLELFSVLVIFYPSFWKR